jgi:hypothetical protein
MSADDPRATFDSSPREAMIDVQDFLHSVYINGGRTDLSDADARRLMRESAERGIEYIDRIISEEL